MLPALALTAVLFAFGTIAVAWVAHAAMARLGLESWKVLLWFGLAEAPVDELAAKRGNLRIAPKRKPASAPARSG